MNSGIKCHWPVVVIIVGIVVGLDVADHFMCQTAGGPLPPDARRRVGPRRAAGRLSASVLLGRLLTRLQRRVGQGDGVVDGLAELLVRVAGCIAAARARGHQLQQELRSLLGVGQIQLAGRVGDVVVGGVVPTSV